MLQTPKAVKADFNTLVTRAKAKLAKAEPKVEAAQSRIDKLRTKLAKAIAP